MDSWKNGNGHGGVCFRFSFDEVTSLQALRINLKRGGCVRFGFLVLGS